MKTANSTRDHFHPSTHAADGSTIRMRNGDFIVIKATAQGWQLVDLVGRSIGKPCKTARGLAKCVHNYPEVH